MSVLYSATTVTLNKQGSATLFSDTAIGLRDVSLFSTTGSNWTQTANHSIYNIVYVKGKSNLGLKFGPVEPLIVVIEKSTDSTNNLLKFHKFLNLDIVFCIKTKGTWWVQMVRIGVISTAYRMIFHETSQIRYAYIFQKSLYLK